GRPRAGQPRADQPRAAVGSVAGSGPARLDAVVLGGDRAAIRALRGDPRLAACFRLATSDFLTVPDPRLAVLRETPRMFRAIRVRLVEPE
ncbi:MAG TPA: Vms1/Ankzf1 family peptidyl-tRNA hydrolase, partial [Streptosporangiaceae bacterium]|nr:Vms1/Ankzf1 family peptidyl-tRNA hydrolase [Streptosporangiaceae bacterium]